MGKNPILPKKQQALIRLMAENGGITLEDGLEIYSHVSTVSKTLNKLEECGITESHQAPRSSEKQKVWFLTDIGEYLAKPASASEYTKY